MVLAKMKNAVVVTGDGKMHFRAEEVGDSGLIRENDLNRVVYELKAEYWNIYKQSVLICSLKNE